MGELFKQKIDRATKLQLHETQYIISSVCEEIRQNYVTVQFALDEIKKKMFSQSPHESHTALFILESVVKNSGTEFQREITEESSCEMFAELITKTPYENVKSKMLRLIQAWAFAFKTTDKYSTLEELMDSLKEQGYHFPEMVETDNILPALPSNIETCHRCHISIIYLPIKLQCRKCGQLFCNKCIKNKPFPKFGAKHEIKVCENCNDILTAAPKIAASGSICGSLTQVGQKMKFMEKFPLPESKLKHTSDLEIMFNSGRFSDVKLIAEERELKAHKIILAEQSLIFNDLLQDPDVTTIQINDINFETAFEMLSFIYKDKVEHLQENADRLLVAANKYGLERLKKLCEKELFEKLSVENVIGILVVAKVNDSPELLTEAIHFVQRNIKEVINLSDWNDFCLKHPDLFNKIFITWVNRSKRTFIMNNIRRHHESFMKKEFNSNAELAEDMSKLMETRKFSDFTIKVGGKKLKVHKNILYTRSSVFACMLCHETVESMKNFVEIKEFDMETVQEMVRFMYSGRVEGMPGIAMKLLPAADKYNLKKLLKICENELYENLSIGNVTQTLCVADSHNCADLKQQAIDFMKTNIFVLTNNGPEWKTFSDENPKLVNEIFKMWVDE